MPRFTFKTEKSTGRYGSFYPDYHIIKLYGYDVGNISDRPPHEIHLQAKKKEEDITKKSPCPWKRVTLAKKFTSVKEANEYLNSPETIDRLFRTIDIWME